jgi:predicted nucleotidyltransferase
MTRESRSILAGRRLAALWQKNQFRLPKQYSEQYRAAATRKLTMRPSVALNLNREAVRDAVSRHRAANPRVFGSAAQGTDRDGSDLDLLVDAQPDATLFDLGALQVTLEELLGIPVDLLTPAELPVRIRQDVIA